MSKLLFATSLSLLCTAFFYLADNYRVKKCNFLVGVPLLILIFFYGVRICFGVDDGSYLDMYVHNTKNSVEPLYECLIHFFFFLHSPYQFYFMGVSGICLFFLFKAIQKYRISYFWSAIVFFTYYFLFYFNILRQSIAVSIIFYSLFYFYKKKYKTWVFLILCACCFHKSSFVMFGLCPLVIMVKKTYNVWFYCIPLMLIIVFYNHLWEISLKVLTVLGVNPFTRKIIEAFLTWQLEVNSGIGIRLKIISYICFLPKFITVAKKNQFSLFMFNLFYIGVFGKYLSGQNMNFARLFVGAHITEFYLFPMAMKSINKKNVFKISSLLCILGLLILIVLFLKDFSNGFYYWDLDFTWKTHFKTVGGN